MAERAGAGRARCRYGRNPSRPPAGLFAPASRRRPRPNACLLVGWLAGWLAGTGTGTGGTGRSDAVASRHQLPHDVRPPPTLPRHATPFMPHARRGAGTDRAPMSAGRHRRYATVRRRRHHGIRCRTNRGPPPTPPRHATGSCRTDGAGVSGTAVPARNSRTVPGYRQPTPDPPRPLSRLTPHVRRGGMPGSPGRSAAGKGDAAERRSATPLRCPAVSPVGAPPVPSGPYQVT